MEDEKMMLPADEDFVEYECCDVGDEEAYDGLAVECTPFEPTRFVENEETVVIFGDY